MLAKTWLLCAVLAVVTLGASLGCDKKTKPETTSGDATVPTTVEVPANTTDSQ